MKEKKYIINVTYIKLTEIEDEQLIATCVSNSVFGTNFNKK